MKKIAIVVLLLVFLSMPGLVRAETGKELTEDPKGFDGRQVDYRGEVIGVMIRGDYAWVNISDGGYAIGVWCTADDARSVSFVGDYSNFGDTVEIVGVYHMACLEHGGDMDIHAESFVISKTGNAIDRAPDLLLVLVSIVLFIVAILVSLNFWRAKKESKKLRPWPTY